MTVLALETSCDETSVAVVQAGRVRANVVSSQVRLHAEYGGVVPELAVREHLRHVTPIVRQALAEAGLGVNDVDVVAATRGPGLPSALMVGFKAAQSLAYVLRKPLYGIHHHEAHLYSAWIEGESLHANYAAFVPHVGLIVSGGHTLLVHVRGEHDFTVLGSTIDDAAGECFDKVAKLIGLPYPGGPRLEALAHGGNPQAHAFPRPLLHDASDDFSFSGLKTSVRYHVRDHPEVLARLQPLRDLCASVQAAIVEVLVTKTLRAARRLGVTCVTAAGGVTCNQTLRRQLESAGSRETRGAKSGEAVTLRFAPPPLCTDNAAMVGVLAERKCRHGAPPTSLDAEIAPGWALGAAP